MTDEEIFKVIDALPTEAKAAIRGVVDEIRREANANVTAYIDESIKRKNWNDPKYLQYIIKSNHIKRKAQVARWKGEAEQYLAIVKQLEKEQRDDERALKDARLANQALITEHQKMRKELQDLKSGEAYQTVKNEAHANANAWVEKFKSERDEALAEVKLTKKKLNEMCWRVAASTPPITIKRLTATDEIIHLNRVIDTVASEKRTAVARLIAQNKALVTRARFWQTQAQKKTRYVANHHKWILRRQGRDLQAALRACFAAETKSQELVGKLHAANIEIQHLNMHVSRLTTHEILEWDKKSSPAATIAHHNDPFRACYCKTCEEKRHIVR